jgi:hypothetical protein
MEAMNQLPRPAQLQDLLSQPGVHSRSANSSSSSSQQISYACNAHSR